MQRWVLANVGDIKHILLTCLISQDQDQDFVSMKGPDQLEMMNKALQLDSVNALTDFLSTVINSYKLLKSHIDLLIKSNDYSSNDTSSQYIENANKKQEELAELEKQRDILE